MKNAPILPPEYHSWLENVKSKIRSAQIKAALAVNSELIQLYWELGRMIVDRQENARWGSFVVERLSLDLKVTFPNLSGFSRANLFFMGQFYRFYQNADDLVLQLVRLTPWGHNMLIFRKLNSVETARFYLDATLKNSWSRTILEIQIESNLHLRQGRSINNFRATCLNLKQKWLNKL